METVLILVFAAIFATMVSNRAARLNRVAWTWWLAAFIISPLLVWIVLEIVGKKKEKLLDETTKELEDQGNFELVEAVND